MSNRIGWQTNCAVNECTGDGRHVGRCWFALTKEGEAYICPRHGNVTEAQKRFAVDGSLMSELEHDPELREAVARRNRASE